jgi:hypothetical protein
LNNQAPETLEITPNSIEFSNTKTKKILATLWPKVLVDLLLNAHGAYLLLSRANATQLILLKHFQLASSHAQILMKKNNLLSKKLSQAMDQRTMKTNMKATTEASMGTTSARECGKLL